MTGIPFAKLKALVNGNIEKDALTEDEIKHARALAWAILRLLEDRDDGPDTDIPGIPRSGQAT